MKLGPNPPLKKSEGASTSLFRSEVYEKENNNWLGAIRLTQPISTLLISIVAATISLAVLLFIVYGSFEKKARVTGITVPINGSLTISAPNNGIILRSMVVEGQEVEEGMPLFELSMERQNRAGEFSSLIQHQLAIRSEALKAERRARTNQTRERKQALELRIENINTEEQQLENELQLIKRRNIMAQKNVDKYETLCKNGFVSTTQVQQKQEEVIDIESRLSSLLRAKAQISSNKISLTADKAQLDNILINDLAQLKHAEAALEQEVIENQSRQKIIVTAPRKGMVTAVVHHIGQTVLAGQTLGTLIPGESNHTQLEVQLFVPSRTIGFVAPGQIALIRYQAYPHQKFGLQKGKIVSISKTPLAPNELPTNLASTILSNAASSSLASNGTEALYRIKVKLDQQYIMAYGKPQTLKPGMTLDADVMQDRRKIWEWIISPIIAISH